MSSKGGRQKKDEFCPTCGKQISRLNSSTFARHPAIVGWRYCFKCDAMMKVHIELLK